MIRFLAVGGLSLDSYRLASSVLTQRTPLARLGGSLSRQRRRLVRPTGCPHEAPGFSLRGGPNFPVRRHEPNLPSGGQVADIEIGAFLIAAGNGPEKQDLCARLERWSSSEIGQTSLGRLIRSGPARRLGPKQLQILRTTFD
jgi:hypothetical protein